MSWELIDRYGPWAIGWALLLFTGYKAMSLVPTLLELWRNHIEAMMKQADAFNGVVGTLEKNAEIMREIKPLLSDTKAQLQRVETILSMRRAE